MDKLHKLLCGKKDTFPKSHFAVPTFAAPQVFQEKMSKLRQYYKVGSFSHICIGPIHTSDAHVVCLG